MQIASICPLKVKNTQIEGKACIWFNSYNIFDKMLLNNNTIIQ